MAGEVFAQGTLLQMGDGATPTENFTTIANVRSIQGPGKTRDTLDITSHSSPNRTREYLSGLKDGGEVTFQVGWNRGEPTHNETAGIEDWFEDDEPRNFRIVFVDGSGRWDCAGICVNTSYAFPTDEVQTCDVTIKVTGLPVLI